MNWVVSSWSEGIILHFFKIGVIRMIKKDGIEFDTVEELTGYLNWQKKDKTPKKTNVPKRSVAKITKKRTKKRFAWTEAEEQKLAGIMLNSVNRTKDLKSFARTHRRTLASVRMKTYKIKDTILRILDLPPLTKLGKETFLSVLENKNPGEDITYQKMKVILDAKKDWTPDRWNSFVQNFMSKSALIRRFLGVKKQFVTSSKEGLFVIR
jgi:hypothetical protein